MQPSVISKSILPGLFLLVSCLLFGNVYATEEPQTADTKKQAAKHNPNKKVCKKVKTTGSHFSKRVCLKQKEWDEMGKNARKTMRDMSTDNRGSF